MMTEVEFLGALQDLGIRRSDIIQLMQELHFAPDTDIDIETVTVRRHLADYSIRPA